MRIKDIDTEHWIWNLVRQTTPEPGSLEIKALKNELLHTGSLAAVVEPGATPLLKACRALRSRPGRVVSIDLNVRPAVLPKRGTYRTQIERLTRETDIVKASDEDQEADAGHPGDHRAGSVRGAQTRAH